MVIATDTPPAGLFARIIRRLGLERQLDVVQRHLGLTMAIAVVVGVLAIFACIGLAHVLERSSFGPFVGLMFSDPRMMLHHRNTFALSLGESMPGSSIAPVLFTIGLLMLCARLVAGYIQRRSSLVNSIHHTHHEHQ